MKNSTRKTISQTHRQAALSYGGAMALAAMLVSPLSTYFQTKEGAGGESKTVETRIVNIEHTQIEIKKTIDDNEKEAVRRQERSNDKIIARIQEAEARTVSNQERVERRVDTLEASILTANKSRRAY